MKVSIVIPSFNGKEIIEPLLNDLNNIFKHSTDFQYEIIVSDDGSTDGTIDWLKSKYPWVFYVPSKQNTGFGATVNRGVAAASGDVLCICNNDIRISDTNIFKTIVDQLSTSRNIFAVMPLVNAVGLGNVIENINWLRVSKGLAWLEKADKITDLPANKNLALCGAFFVCRKIDYTRLNGFDAAYNQAYWEDVDLGLRANAEGMSIELIGNCTVRHEHSQTISTSFGDRWKTIQLLKNQLIFCKKHSKTLKLGYSSRIWHLLRALKWISKHDLELAKIYFQAAIHQNR